MATTEPLKETPWIVMGPNPYKATCARCWKTINRATWPNRAQALMLAQERFRREHKQCRDER